MIKNTVVGDLLTKSDLGDLMDKLAESNTTDDIDKLIAVYRKARVDFERGVKPKKDTPSADMTNVMAVLAPKPKGTFRR